MSKKAQKKSSKLCDNSISRRGGCNNINIFQPFIITTTLQVTVDTDKGVNLETEDPINEHRIDFNLKSIKRFETPEKFSVGTVAQLTDAWEYNVRAG
jgi:hypothetical protein